MNTKRHIFSLGRGLHIVQLVSAYLLFTVELCSAATTLYVVKDNPGAKQPFTSWDTAAADIQSAIDVAAEEDLILVGNGLYDVGTTRVADFTNRIVVSNAVTVQSANGPEVTTLQGGLGVRCATLLGSARLIGFRLTGSVECGAVWGEGGSASVENCWLVGNSAVRGGGAQGVHLLDCTLSENVASLQGGGAYDCSMQNCLLLHNSAEQGGGASASFLWNCTVTSNNATESGGGTFDSVLRGCLVVENTANQGGGCAGPEGVIYSTTLWGNHAAMAGGGVQGGTLYNSIVYGNDVQGISNEWSESVLQYCLSSPLPSGDGNRTGDPLFVDPIGGNLRLQSESPCINIGSNENWMTTATDLDGSSRIVDEVVDLGTYEHNPPPVPNPQLLLLGINGEAIESGNVPDVGAGTDWIARSDHSVSHTLYVTNSGNATLVLSGTAFSGAGADAFSIYAFPSSVEPGFSLPFQIAFHPDEVRSYEATLQISHSASNTSSPFALNVRGTGVLPANRYVALGNPQAATPYTNWLTAAADIQSAIAVSLADDTIWVSNGIYSTGSVAGLGEVLHRVAITNAIVVRSVNGPGTTIIQGESGVRCAYLGVNATLSGFTLTNGVDAGGIGCADKTAQISNCVIVGNSSPVGGGVLDGTIRNSILAGNSSDSGGGAFNARLIACELIDNTAELGGGAYDSEMDRCVLSGNTAEELGGGVYACIVNNSLLVNNSATQGGGAYGGHLSNCTLVQNNASVEGGGTYGCELLNCILSDNDDHMASSTLSYCCVPQLVPGLGNIDADPLFVDQAGGDFHLATNSPCINAGNHQAWMDSTLDVTGSLRVVGPAVDMGAYEHPFTPSGIEAQWLKDNNLPWDGSADSEDTDHDLFSNWKEWRANTDPHDATSLLALAPPSTAVPPDGVGWIVRWQSSTGKLYRIEYSTNLLSNPSFQLLPDAHSIPGQMGFTTYTDRNEATISSTAYRIYLQ